MISAHTAHYIFLLKHIKRSAYRDMAVLAYMSTTLPSLPRFGWNSLFSLLRIPVIGWTLLPEVDYYAVIMCHLC